IFKALGALGDYIDYDEWTVEGDAYNVKIDHSLVYFGSSYSNLMYMHSLGYSRYTEQDVRDAINEKQMKNNEVDSDL
ncbi:MAG TPA: hypothetical protein VLA21_05260, partial [Candidatus Limnocylindria bacterium]|nr:hypothetical protein [Candidatus Limnocylindria bacterium]